MSTQTHDRPPTSGRGARDGGRSFLGHPRGLSTLFFVELWERFSYYGMRAILLYFLVDTAANGGLGIDKTTGTAVVAIYGSSVYLLSIIGGFCWPSCRGSAAGWPRPRCTSTAPRG
ncbi:MAG: transporter [Humibacillus sp.]|nr:transporter [Humibacillus sp.]